MRVCGNRDALQKSEFDRGSRSQPLASAHKQHPNRECAPSAIHCLLGSAGHALPEELETMISNFWAIFRIENCIPRSLSAMTGQTGPLNACYNTTQHALSTHVHSVVSTPSISDLDEKSKYRLISPGRGETRLDSCVCGVHEGRYSTDNNSAPRACCVVSIERGAAA